MGKKEKSAAGLTEEFKSLVAQIPKLEKLLKMYDEISAGYLKYRKNGGAAIPGIEKHLGIKIPVAQPEANKKVPTAKPVKQTESVTDKAPEKKKKSNKGK